MAQTDACGYKTKYRNACKGFTKSRMAKINVGASPKATSQIKVFASPKATTELRTCASPKAT
ncbi:Hypothetical predicted protein, partial [Paramuricea clavata]